MIDSKYDYKWLPQNQLSSIIVDGGIMPKRNNKNILRGEDIAFLIEGENDRCYPYTQYKIYHGNVLCVDYDRQTISRNFTNTISKEQIDNIVSGRMIDLYDSRVDKFYYNSYPRYLKLLPQANHYVHAADIFETQFVDDVFSFYRSYDKSITSCDNILRKNDIEKCFDDLGNLNHSFSRIESPAINYADNKRVEFAYYQNPDIEITPTYPPSKGWQYGYYMRSVGSVRNDDYRYNCCFVPDVTNYRITQNLSTENIADINYLWLSFQVTNNYYDGTTEESKTESKLVIIKMSNGYKVDNGTVNYSFNFDLNLIDNLIQICGYEKKQPQYISGNQSSFQDLTIAILGCYLMCNIGDRTKWI